MNAGEIDAWRRWASPETVQSVARAAMVACDDWQRRILRPWELADVASLSAMPLLFPETVAERAAAAAVEVAIVVSVWRDGLDEVLRPGRMPVRKV